MADDDIKEENGNTRWGAILSSAAKLKSSTPGLTAIKEACWVSYGSGSRAVGSLGRAIGASVPGMVAGIVPDPDRRNLIGKAIGGAVASASSAALEDASGLIPGGRLAYRSVKAGATRFNDVYSKGLPAGADGSNKEPDCVKKMVVEKRLDDLDLKLRELRTENDKLKEEVTELRTTPAAAAAAAAPSPSGASRTTGAVVDGPHREPEDVIRLFMMRGFKGGDFLDCLLVPSRRGGAESSHTKKSQRTSSRM